VWTLLSTKISKYHASTTNLQAAFATNSSPLLAVAGRRAERQYKSSQQFTSGLSVRDLCEQSDVSVSKYSSPHLLSPPQDNTILGLQSGRGY